MMGLFFPYSLGWYVNCLCYLLLTQAGMVLVSAVLFSPRLVAGMK
jgi:hypothetical protein